MDTGLSILYRNVPNEWLFLETTTPILGLMVLLVTPIVFGIFLKIIEGSK